MDSAPPTSALPALPAAAARGALRNVIFRFLFVYLLLYSLPQPFERLRSLPVGAVHQDLQPASAWYAEHVGARVGEVTGAYEAASESLVTWTGRVVLGIQQHIEPFRTGSGDTTRDYVRLRLCLVLAFLLSIGWGLVDRRRGKTYLRADWLLAVYLRFVLAATLLGYGCAKFFEGQFPAISGPSLLSTWGDSSPMGVVWKFMGSSPEYTVFTGVVECLGGVLLFWWRTSTVGALLAAAAMGNVFLINCCYDVPVKQYSGHLLLMALVLLWRDRQLIGAVLWRRAAPAVPRPVHVPFPTWLEVILITIKWVFVAWILLGAYAALKARYEQSLQPQPPLAGFYRVEEFSLDRPAALPEGDLPDPAAVAVDAAGPPTPGVAEAAVTSGAQAAVPAPPARDELRWEYVHFVFRYGSRVAIRTGDEATRYLQLAVDEDAGTLTLQGNRRADAAGEPSAEQVLRYRIEPAPVADRDPAVAPGPPPAVFVELDGEYFGHTVHARLRRMTDDEFLVHRQGFRWVQEFPFNR